MNHEALRNIAKSGKWQNLFARAKDLGNLQLFCNNMDFTKAQVWLFYYLEVYQSLYSDLNSGEDFINDEVINDSLRVDAYILYRNEKRKKEFKSHNKDDNKIKSTGGLPSVKFVSRKK